MKVDQRDAQINYAGAAPFLVAGVLQVNAVVPLSLQSNGPNYVELKVGNTSSPTGVTVAIKVD